MKTETKVEPKPNALVGAVNLALLATVPLWGGAFMAGYFLVDTVRQGDTLDVIKKAASGKKNLISALLDGDV